MTCVERERWSAFEKNTSPKGTANDNTPDLMHHACTPVHPAHLISCSYCVAYTPQPCN